MEEVWSRSFEVEGRMFEAVFSRRPFREGLEVTIEVDGKTLRLAEFGFGETAMLEKAKAAVLVALRGDNR
jgi:hypothetical protein